MNYKQTSWIVLIFVLGSYLLQGQSNLETVVQKGHSAAVKCIAVSHDGKYVATGSRDKTLKIWDLQSGFEIRTFVGHLHTVNGVEFSPDDKYLLSSSADNTAKVWNIFTGESIFTTPEQDKYLTDVAFSSNGKFIVATGYNDSAQVYNFTTGKLINQYPINADQGSGYGSSVAYSPDDKYIAFGEDNKTASVYSAIDHKLIYSFKPALGWCGGCGTQLAFSPDSKYLAKLSHNDKASIYDLTTGKLVKTLGKEVDKIHLVQWSTDGKRLLVGAENKAYQWDVDKEILIDSVKIDSVGDVNELIYNSNSTQFLAACGKNVALIYDLGKKTPSLVLTGVINKIDKGGLTYDPDDYWQSHIAKYIRLKNLLLLNKDDNSFFTGKMGTKCLRWNIASGAPEQMFVGHSKAVICFDLSMDGKWLLTGDGDGEAIIWDILTGKKIKSFKGHRDPLFEVKFNPNGESILTTSWDAKAIVWNIESGKKETVIDLDNYSAFSAAFSSDGLYIALGKFDKSLILMEPDSKKIVYNFAGHTDVVASIQFSADRNKMLTASWDGTARIWDITTGLMTQKFKGNSGALHCAIYANEGKTVITGGDDRMIKIWDAKSGKMLNKLVGHQAEITSLQASKDGKLLVSYSLDGVIKFWNLEKGIEFFEHIHISENEWMARTKEGFFNATHEARQLIHFIKGMDIYQPDQFFEEFYRPDLMPKLLKNRGLQTGSIDGIDQKLTKSPPPIIKMYLKPIESGLETEVVIKIQDAGGGVADLKLTHNGKALLFDNEKLQFPSGKDNSTVYKQTVGLVHGLNTFAAIGISKGNVESTPVKVEVYSQKAPNEMICHVMAVGINQYKNPQLTLSYAKDDALAFVNNIKEKGQGLFSKIKVHALYDQQATKQGILDTLQKIVLSASSHDVFIFFYAGHGSMVDNKFYFIPTDCIRLFDQSNVSLYGIEALELQEKFKNIKALKQMIIMDACQSGGSVELLSVRGAMEEKAIAQLSRSAGIHVMASAGSEQNAKEISELKHGLFTYVLLEALAGKADGAPKDGKVTIYELKSYLDDQVPELNNRYSGKIQYPFTFSRGQDFPIVKW